MNQEWQQFLNTQGAEFSGNTIAHFGTFERERRLVCAGTVIAALTNHTILRISGEDAEIFLSNQLTNDIKQISETQAQVSAWCTHQGKVLATFLVSKQHDVFYLLLASDLVTNMVQRLGMFVLNAKVQIEKLDGWVAMEVIINSDHRTNLVRPIRLR